MPTNPESESVRIKRDAHARIDRETAGMTPAQRDAFINTTAATLANELGFRRVSSPVGRRGAVGIPSSDTRNTAA